MILKIEVNEEDIYKEVALATNNYLENGGIMSVIRTAIAQKIADKFKDLKIMSLYAKVNGNRSKILKLERQVAELKAEIKKQHPYSRLK